jgi:hypothetical protein
MRKFDDRAANEFAANALGGVPFGSPNATRAHACEISCPPMGLCVIPADLAEVASPASGSAWFFISEHCFRVALALSTRIE